MTEIAITIIAVALILYLTVSPFICLYWCRGGLFYEGSQRLWRANHKVLSKIIGIGGFIGTCLIINLGMLTMLSFIPLFPEHPLWICLGIFPFLATLFLYDEGYKFIRLRENKDRELSIQNELDNLRRHYYRDWDRANDEFDWTEEEHKQIIAAEIREQIDKLNKSIGSATKKGRLQILRREEIEALYMFLDEVSGKKG